MSVEYGLKSLTLMERAGDRNVPRDIEPSEARPGDVVEMNTLGGTVMSVDPITQKATATPKRFIIDGAR